ENSQRPSRHRALVKVRQAWGLPPLTDRPRFKPRAAGVGASTGPGSRSSPLTAGLRAGVAYGSESAFGGRLGRAASWYARRAWAPRATEATKKDSPWSP